MNKTELITEVSHQSGVNSADCKKVIDAFETVFSAEIKRSGWKKGFFGTLYKIMSAFRSKMALLFVLLAFSANAGAQTIRGAVTDAASGEPIYGANVYLTDKAGVGATTDSLGKFIITNVSVGRHTVQASYLGYEPTILKEIMVSSAKETYLEIAMKESVQSLGEVVVHPRVNKEQPLNKMATTGARMLSVEEASRYAGGFGDPARLASSFSGISTDGTTNGISIHGNAPHLLSWHIEGVEIPNPNHFADISVAGGGIVSSLSAQVLGNSDFFTGAFPAEYGNAVSGVFDVKLRNGNNQNYEHTAQVGTLGIDVASEGPIGRKNGASYIANYRYSAIGLATKLGMIDMEGQNLDYQDLNFKINAPTKRAGTFSVWGTALIDNTDNYISDTTKWETTWDKYHSISKQYMAAGGVGHLYFFKHGGQLKTTVASTFYKENGNMYSYADDMSEIHTLKMNRQFTNLIFDMAYNRKFSARFTNKTGVTYTRMFYKMDMGKAQYIGQSLDKVYEGNGNTGLLSAYTSNAVNFSNNFTLNFGLNAQWLALNDKWTLEPRLGVRWQPTKRSTFAAAYGMHSRAEKMNVYFEELNNEYVNKNLGFTKAHHFMLSYALKISENTNLKIEPFYQYLYNVPVEDGGSFSVLNNISYYIDKALVNKGKGRNYGVDITLERYLNKGWYGLLTTSVFNSRYCGGDGVWRNSRYNRHYIINMLGGKEWMMGKSKQNVLAVSLKLTCQGGDHYTPYDESATLAHPDKDVQYDETRAFSKQYGSMFSYTFSASYKINKRNVAHKFGVEVMSGAKTYNGDVYNFRKNQIEPLDYKLSLPNIYYKIEF